MENRMSWGRAELVVHDALVRHRRALEYGSALRGTSLERQITDGLREAGLLKDEGDE